LETVLKVGGSLLNYPDKLKKLCTEISRLSRDFKLLVIPGGGSFADLVRRYYVKYRLSEDTSHWMAILAMDTYGFLLSELIKNSQVVFTIEGIYKAWKNGGLPILLPFRILFEEDPLIHSWSVTSDSISAYIARKIKAKRLILLKDVDGIYNDNNELIGKIGLKQLSEMNTCIDRYFPKVLEGFKIECYVVNGLYPDRVKKLILGLETIATKITMD